MLRVSRDTSPYYCRFALLPACWQVDDAGCVPGPKTPSSLALLPPPSRPPGEGNPAEAVELVGCAVRTFGGVHGAHSAPYGNSGPEAFPSPGRGRAVGEGTG